MFEWIDPFPGVSPDEFAAVNMETGVLRYGGPHGFGFTNIYAATWLARERGRRIHEIMAESALARAVARRR